MTNYHHTKFGLDWIKEAKLRRGRTVEDVLNRSGEIGLRSLLLCGERLTDILGLIIKMFYFPSLGASSGIKNEAFVSICPMARFLIGSESLNPN